MGLAIDTAYLSFAKKSAPGIQERSVRAVLELHAEGATVPFMARYRKERTGNLDEVQIRNVIESFETYQEIVKRKEFITTEIAKQGSLTDDLKRQIEQSFDLSEIEELYRPYKKKRKTKAKIALDAGLGPLADWVLKLGSGELQDDTSLEVKAKEFINPEAGFATYEEVLRGVMHIIAEKLTNSPELRALVKEEYSKNGKVVSQKSKDFKPNSKFSMYAEFSEPVQSLQNRKASHRYLAIRRGWQENELKVSIEADDAMLLKHCENAVLKNPASHAANFLKEAAKHALMIHIVPSVVNEIHAVLKEKADKDAIHVFAENVRRVLMASPFGARVVLGVDPGIRTGAKIALVDRSGQFLTHTVMQIQGEGAKETAKKLFGETLSQMQIDAIAVGNGTAGRETEKFLREVLKEIGKEVPVVMVNESGASVYSASEVARDEFPDLDITVRGAISIARRLQDPLAELVKIEPKSIGVGQYQHDVDQNQLKKSLHNVVESCVNAVGVDVNTASTSLLQYVAGIGPAIAKNIISYRAEKGLFQDRQELMKVPQLSSKTFEQAAGFLRIRGKVTLDQTGIHPERYQAVRDMLNEAGLTVAQALGGQADKLLSLRDKWVQLIGEYTFDDIMSELKKPGRDPRDPYKLFSYRDDIHEVSDLKVDMICPGIVTNVTNFGAFVDIGVHQDGLVHISQLTHNFVDDPRLVVNPGDQVMVKVIGVDLEKKQIALTMKLEEKPQQQSRPRRENVERGDRSSRPERGERRPRPEQQARGRGPNGQNRQRGDNRPRGPGRDGGKPRGDGPRQRGDRPRGGQPFNNPFAALQDLKKG